MSGTAQNVVGIVVAGLATFGVNVLVARTLGKGGLGVITVATQAAFVVSFATRAGMDMAVLLDVAIEIGVDRREHIRALVARAVVIAFGVSAAAALLIVAFADPIEEAFSFAEGSARWAVHAAAVGIPFIALTNVWLSATRGLKLMRYTLYIFWAGQPLLWIVLMTGGWLASETAWMGVAAYSGSWALASVAALVAWSRESSAWPAEPIEAGTMARLARYASPRAAAALLAQLLFWADLFILTRYATTEEVGVYSAALRVGQVLVLFLLSVNLMFSPYVADLHNRGERDRLDLLYKSLTRWALAATIPIALLLFVAPDSVLRLFGAAFSDGDAALRILIAGQLVNVATGSVGFILIMVGRTGWDLAVYALSLAIDVVVALILTPRLGMEGAAIANAITFALSNSIRLVLVMRFVRIQPYDRHYLKLLPPAAASLATMALVHAWIGGGWAVDLVATAGLGMIVYVGTYLVVGLTADERQGLARLRAGLARR